MTKGIFWFKTIAVSFFAAYLTILCVPNKPIKTLAEVSKQKSAECVIETNSGRILYETNGDLRLPMASTTKILTAITVLEVCSNLNEEVEISHESVGVEGSSVYLKEGEKYTLEDLLYGLMLRSGNDCAVALAIHCEGSLEEFSSKMNEVAQKAGALNSRFSNPHGLPSKNHYTTARDLCYITRYAMKNPIFQKIVSTKYYEKRSWKNKNKMLNEYDGANGVKTGYTKEAGRCLVSSAKRDNMSLICVVLNCQDTYGRSSELLDGGFETYKLKPILEEGKTLKFEENGRTILGYCKESFYYPLSEGEDSQLEFRLLKEEKKGKDGEILGQFGIYLSKRLLFSGNLYKL